MTRLLAEARWAAARVGYWIRPYDMLADDRRWRWQPRARCGLPPTPDGDAILAAALRYHDRPDQPVCHCPRTDLAEGGHRWLPTCPSTTNPGEPHA